MVDQDEALTISYKIDYGFTVTGNRIVDAVLDNSGETWNDLKARDRSQPVVFYRQVCMYLMRKYTSMSNRAIGEPFSCINHATVIHAGKTVINLYETKHLVVKSFVDDVERTLEERGDIREIVEYDRVAQIRDATRPLLSPDVNEWTKGEITIISTLYEKFTASEIAAMLQRSESSMKAKIASIGLKKPVTRKRQP